MTAWVVRQQIRERDFRIVPRRVGEAAVSIAVPQRPDIGDIGSELIVDQDVAFESLTTPATSRTRSSVFGRRPMASSTCVPTISGVPLEQAALHYGVVSFPGKGEALRVEADRDTFVLQGLANRLRHVFILAWDEKGSCLDDS
jgi:hypothetical protein